MALAEFNPFRLLVGFEGRIGRAPFWAGGLLVMAALLVVECVAPSIGGEGGPRLVAFASIFALYPWSALAAKRAADRGRPQAWGIGLVLCMTLGHLLAGLLPAQAQRLPDAAAAIAWCLALFDLGLLPGRDLASRRTAAKPAR